MKLKSCLYFILAIRMVYAQPDNNIIADLSDVYILSMSFNEKLLGSTCNCDVGTQKNICDLWDVKIDSVLLIRDSTVYTKEDLLNLNYVVMLDSQDIYLNTSVVVFAGNSVSREYIVANKIIHSSEAKVSVNDMMPYIQGLISCYKLTFWQKLRIKLGANREKVYANARVLSDDDNSFVEFISKQPGESNSIKTELLH